MIQINEAIIGKIICHRVCNDELKSIISDDTIAIANSDDGKIFTEILLKPFQNSEMVYEFYHEIDLNLNVIYKIAQDIYNGEEFVRKSQDIVSHLVKSSRYPNIKDGDLLIATFEDVVVENKYNPSSKTHVLTSSCSSFATAFPLYLANEAAISYSLRSLYSCAFPSFQFFTGL